MESLVNPKSEEHRPESRKGLCGATHPAKRMSAIIFPEQIPKHTLSTDPSFLEKLKSGKPLTNEERNEALYHPNLFNQGRAAPVSQPLKPWEIGREIIPFRASRKLAEAPARSASVTEPQEDNVPSGKRMFKQVHESEEAVEKFSKKHFEPPKSGEEQELFQSPKKRVEGVRAATINLTMSTTADENAPKQRYSRKQVGSVRSSLINLKLDDPNEGPAACNVRNVRRLKPSDNKGAERCPYGTEYSFDKVQPKPKVSNTFHSSIDLHVGGSKPIAARATGVAKPPHYGDHGNILTWK